MRICSWKDGRSENESNQTVILVANSGLRNHCVAAAAKANLAMQPAPPVPNNQAWPQQVEPTIPANGRKPGAGSRRKLFVLPLLEAKGWSIFEWSEHAKVDFHTVDDYLKGKTNPYPSTRVKLAASLDTDVEKLPG